VFNRRPTFLPVPISHKRSASFGIVSYACYRRSGIGIFSFVKKVRWAQHLPPLLFIIIAERNLLYSLNPFLELIREGYVLIRKTIRHFFAFQSFVSLSPQPSFQIDVFLTIMSTPSSFPPVIVAVSAFSCWLVLRIHQVIPRFDRLDFALKRDQPVPPPSY